MYLKVIWKCLQAFTQICIEKSENNENFSYLLSPCEIKGITLWLSLEQLVRGFSFNLGHVCSQFQGSCSPQPCIVGLKDLTSYRLIRFSRWHPKEESVGTQSPSFSLLNKGGLIFLPLWFENLMMLSYETSSYKVSSPRIQSMVNRIKN